MITLGRFVGLALVALAATACALVATFWLIEYEGELTQGSFKGVTIGDEKSDVWALCVRNEDQRSGDLKLVGVLTPGGQYEPIDKKAATFGEISKYDAWMFEGSDWLKEVVEVTFEGGKVVRIEFTRAPLDP